jgi:hypothetical protein
MKRERIDWSNKDNWPETFKDQLVRDVCKSLLERSQEGYSRCGYNINCFDFCPFKTAKESDKDGKFIGMACEFRLKPGKAPTYDEVTKKAATFYVQYGGKKEDVLEYLI